MNPSNSIEQQPFQLEMAFTDTYRQFIDLHPAVREAHCLRVLYPALFEEICAGDRFAGRINYRAVGFGLEQASGGPGYYCSESDLRSQMAETAMTLERQAEIEGMIEFWKGEATIEGKLIPFLPADVLEGTTNQIAHMFGRLSGALIDFHKLVSLGIPGLRAEVNGSRRTAESESRDTGMYTGWSMALDLLVDVCLHYARQSRELATAPDIKAGWRAELETIAITLERIVVAKPETLREAVQLAWLYALISGVVNYGRMDVYLGDYYAHDIDSGRITEKEALSYLQSLWQLIADRQIWFNGRVIVGGLGRPNEANADRFALAAMEATRTVLETEPQLTLRFAKGQNPALMEKALDVIGEGRTFPMLYNDDVNVPAVEHGFCVPRADAEQYLPYGCGEYALDHISFGSPNCSLNLLKALEITLHNGRDAMAGKVLGLAAGAFRDFKTFEDFLNAYNRQVECFTQKLAERHAMEYEAETRSAGFLYISLLFDHCIERGRSVVNRGTRYSGGVVETFGMVNAADSLMAIKKLVFEQQVITQDELLAALEVNFEGFERIRRILLAAPKYGNDNLEADRMMQTVSDHVAGYTRAQAKRVGLDYYLVVNINNYANVSSGKITAASADGRFAGEPLANGNTPTAGNDRKGITAFLNSIARVDPSCHAGYVHNMKFTRRLFREDRPKLKALLDGYFSQGGTQAMITVVSRDDMENAMREPEKYRNLIVRVGGFSHRFVDLARDVQIDLVNRTLYD